MAYRLLWNNVYDHLQIAVQNVPEGGCQLFDYSPHLPKISGFDKIDQEYTAVHIHKNQEEKGLQEILQKQLELLLQKSIITERMTDIIDPETKGYFIKKELRLAIDRINRMSIMKDLFKAGKIECKDKLSTPDEQKIYDNAIEKITQTIIKKALRIMSEPDGNTEKKGVKLYNFYFKTHNDIESDGVTFKFIVLIDTNSNLLGKENKNKITIIRERNLSIGNNKREIPDFAVFFNGLPFIAIELKKQYVNDFSGEYVAHKDYIQKKSYHNFLAFIGSNGVYAFITSNPDVDSFYLWMEYEKNNTVYNKTPETDKNGLYDIIIDLFIDPRKFLFYFESCTMPSETRQQYLKNARIQQFRTAYKFFESLKNNEKEGKTKKIKNYFQHHARTGKTFTFKIIAKMLYKKKVGNFKKIIFFVPDVSSVFPSILKEFNNLEFPNGTACKIDSKEDYLKELKAIGKEFSFHIVNMQLITDTNYVIDDSDNVMIFIDEVHTFQKTKEMTNENNETSYKTLADKRNTHFPNASFISATASPLIEIMDNGDQVDITEATYGKCIDVLTPRAAIALKLVTPLIYVKKHFALDDTRMNNLHGHTYLQTSMNETNMQQTLEDLNTRKEEFLQRFERKNKVTVSQNVKDFFFNTDFIDHPKKMLNPLPEDNVDYEVMNKLISFLTKIILKDVAGKVREYNRSIEHLVWETLLKFKIDQVVIPTVLDQRLKYTDFMPKFFYMVPPKSGNDERVPGMIMKETIKDMIRTRIEKKPDYDRNLFNVEHTIYCGVRFEFDGNESILDVPEDERPVITQFEADEKKNTELLFKPIDVLILVRKRTRGYDNANLFDVFLDRIFGDDNYQEMLQMSTRGTTMREGKKYSRLIDLTGTDSNYLLYNETMSIYNKDGENIVISDEIITTVMNNIEISINHFISHLINSGYFQREEDLSLFQVFLKHNIARNENDTTISQIITTELGNENDNVTHAFKQCMLSIRSELKKVPFSINDFMTDSGRTELSSVFMELFLIYSDYITIQMKENRNRLHTEYHQLVKEILLQLFPDIHGFDGIRECINQNLRATLTLTEELAEPEDVTREENGNGAVQEADEDGNTNRNNHIPTMRLPNEVIAYQYGDMLDDVNHEEYQYLIQAVTNNLIRQNKILEDPKTRNIFRHIYNITYKTLSETLEDREIIELVINYADYINRKLIAASRTPNFTKESLLSSKISLCRKQANNKLDNEYSFDEVFSGYDDDIKQSFKKIIRQEHKKYDEDMSAERDQNLMSKIFSPYLTN